MSNYLIKGETLTNIANAIRTKTGKTDSIATENMATEISGIEDLPLYKGAYEINENGGGGGDSPELTPTEGLKYSLNDDNASYTCSGIGTATDTDIVIPNTYDRKPVTKISSGFKGNTSIISVSICEGVYKIMYYAFENCSSLTTVRIPKSINYIDSAAFDGTKAIKEVHICDLDAWCYINFQNGTSNPTATSGIADLYLNGEIITDLVIPKSVTKISANAFRSLRSLNSVVIHNAVTIVYSYAFYGCLSLKEVTVEATTPQQIDASIFLRCDNLQAIYVPAESVETYKAATNWSAYADKIKAIA